MPGDIVELKAHYERITEPWSGFDEAAARFFAKALTFKVTLVPLEGDPVVKTIGWQPPRYYDTNAGPVGVARDKKMPTRWDIRNLLSTLNMGWDLRRSAKYWVRDGAVIEKVDVEQKKSRSSRGRAPRRRVILPPSK
jgi:hypothetical protein